MFARLAEHPTIRSEQPLITLGMSKKSGPGLNEAVELDDARHARQVATCGGLHLGDQIDPA